MIGRLRQSGPHPHRHPRSECLGLRAYIQAIRYDDVDRVAIERSLALEDPNREIPMQHRPRLNAATLDALYGHLDRAEAGLLAEHRQIVESGEDHELPYVSCLLALDAGSKVGARPGGARIQRLALGSANKGPGEEGRRC